MGERGGDWRKGEGNWRWLGGNGGVSAEVESGGIKG